MSQAQQSAVSPARQQAASAAQQVPLITWPCQSPRAAYPYVPEILPDDGIAHDQALLAQAKRRKLENRVLCTLSDAAVSMYPQQAQQMERLRRIDADLSTRIANKRAELTATHAVRNVQRRTLRIWMSSELSERSPAQGTSGPKYDYLIRIEGELLNAPKHLPASATRLSAHFDKMSLQIPPEVHKRGHMFEWSRMDRSRAAGQREELDGLELRGDATEYVNIRVPQFSYRVALTRRRHTAGMPGRFAVTPLISKILRVEMGAPHWGVGSTSDLVKAIEIYAQQHGLLKLDNPARIICDPYLTELLQAQHVFYHKLSAQVHELYSGKMLPPLTINGTATLNLQQPVLEHVVDIEIDLDIAMHDAQARVLQALHPSKSLIVPKPPPATQSTRETPTAGKPQGSQSASVKSVTVKGVTAAPVSPAVVKSEAVVRTPTSQHAQPSTPSASGNSEKNKEPAQVALSDMEQDAETDNRAVYLANAINTRCRRMGLLCELGADPFATLNKLVASEARNQAALSKAMLDQYDVSRFYDTWNPQHASILMHRTKSRSQSQQLLQVQQLQQMQQLHAQAQAQSRQHTPGA